MRNFGLRCRRGEDLMALCCGAGRAKYSKGRIEPQYHEILFVIGLVLKLSEDEDRANNDAGNDSREETSNNEIKSRLGIEGNRQFITLRLRGLHLRLEYILLRRQCVESSGRQGCSDLVRSTRTRLNRRLANVKARSKKRWTQLCSLSPPSATRSSTFVM